MLNWLGIATALYPEVNILQVIGARLPHSQFREAIRFIDLIAEQQPAFDFRQTCCERIVRRLVADDAASPRLKFVGHRLNLVLGRVSMLMHGAWAAAFAVRRKS